MTGNTAFVVVSVAALICGTVVTWFAVRAFVEVARIRAERALGRERG